MPKKWWEKLNPKGTKIVPIDPQPFLETVPLDQVDQATGMLKCAGVPFCPFCNDTLQEVKDITRRLK